MLSLSVSLSLCVCVSLGRNDRIERDKYYYTLFYTPGFVLSKVWILYLKSVETNKRVCAVSLTLSLSRSLGMLDSMYTRGGGGGVLHTTKEEKLWDAVIVRDSTTITITTTEAKKKENHVTKETVPIYLGVVESVGG